MPEHRVIPVLHQKDGLKSVPSLPTGSSRNKIRAIPTYQQADVIKSVLSVIKKRVNKVHSKKFCAKIIKDNQDNPYPR
jgi:hypothetical protein